MNPLKKPYNIFKKTCTPAQLYFILGLIAIIGSLKLNIKFNMTILNVCILLLWTFLLNMFCNWGWGGLSWFLVLLPYVLLLLVIFLLPLVVKEGFIVNKSNNKNIDSITKSIEQKSRNTFANRKKLEGLLNSFKK